MTYGISWGIPGVALLLSYMTGAFTVSLREYTPLSYLIIWSPAISAFTVIGLSHGWIGLRSYLRRLLHPGFSWVCCAVVLLGVPLMNLLAAVSMKIFTGEWFVTPSVSLGTFMMTVLLKGTEGPFEELGWRGYALPLLQRRYSGLGASIILGFLWMLWHVPALFIETVMTGVIQGSVYWILLRLFVGGIATTIVMTVIYNGCGGSIPLMFLWHWLSNVPYPWEQGSGINVMQDVLIVLVAMFLVLTVRDRHLGRENLFIEAIPGISETVDA